MVPLNAYRMFVQTNYSELALQPAVDYRAYGARSVAPANSGARSANSRAPTALANPHDQL